MRIEAVAREAMPKQIVEECLKCLPRQRSAATIVSKPEMQRSAENSPRLPCESL